jgi:hypothetical protein
MLQHAMNGRKAFEVTLYNKDVRAAVKENQSHLIYGDHWADAQIQDVMASDEVEALNLIDLRYPREEGFVIQKLAECLTEH